MRDLDEIEQMCSAPSDAYSAGEWCEVANDLLERLRKIDVFLLDPHHSHRMLKRKEIGRIVHRMDEPSPQGLTG